MPRICVVQINVADMDVAVDFYVRKLGFELRSRRSYPKVVELGQEQFTLLLYLVERPARVDYPKEAQILINIETANLEKDLERLRKLNVEVLHSAPVRCPVGTYAAIRDPSGNVLELLEYSADIPPSRPAPN